MRWRATCTPGFGRGEAACSSLHYQRTRTNCGKIATQFVTNRLLRSQITVLALLLAVVLPGTRSTVTRSGDVVKPDRLLDEDGQTMLIAETDGGKTPYVGPGKDRSGGDGRDA